MLLVPSLDGIDFSYIFLSQNQNTGSYTGRKKKRINKVCKKEECSKMYMIEKYSGISY